MRRAMLSACSLVVCLAPALSFAYPALSGPKQVTATVVAGSSPLRLAIPDASPTVDPALVADEENVQLANLLYMGLVRLDDRYRVVPAAASHYTLWRDHRTYTFYLRRDLRFSNGHPVTAYDFRYAITRALNPTLKSPSAATYLLDIAGAADVLTGKSKSLRGLKVIDRYTLQITARWAVPYFLMELTYPTSFALDEKHMSRLGPVDSTAWYSSPVGSGPYRLKSWVPNSKMVLVPNKYFRGPPPSLKQVTISLDPLPRSNLYRYLTHSLDAVSLPAYDKHVVHQDGIVDTDMLSVAGLYMNFRVKPFNSALVRQALTLSIDRNQIVPAAMGSAATPFAGSVPPGEWGYYRGLHTLPYDPARARTTLQRGGVNPKSFPSMTLYYADDTSNARLARAVVKQWHRNLGITVDTRALTVNTLFSQAESGSLPLYLSGWSADYPDPHDWLSSQWESKANNDDVAYRSARFDALVRAADVTWNPDRRLRLYNAAQQQLVDDAAWIPLFVRHRLVYLRPSVANLVVTGFGLIPRGGSWADVRVLPPTAKCQRAF